MKSKQRRSFSAEMKARIALEAIKGQKTIQEIASHYGVHPNQVTTWKRQAVEGTPSLFVDRRSQPATSDEALKAELYQQFGQLQVELDWLKKSPACHVRPEAGVDNYGRFYPTALKPLWRQVNDYLVRWMQRKYMTLARGATRAAQALGRLAERAPRSFVHWEHGFIPAAR